MGFLKQYMGLRKELYIIFWGRVVTNMGALIWPMMTLILKNKLGYSASQVAGIMMILGFVQLPCTLIGGKLADRFSKRNIIIVCDLVTVVSYFICAFLPIDRKMIPLLAVAALFAQMEWPSYDALVADLSSVNDRERAYSLNYLGLNLGLVLAPILGGFLFAEHLNLAFLISSIATFSSTILIFFFIKDITPVQEESVSSQYEQAKSDQSIWKILGKNPLLYLFLFCGGLWSLVYSQFNFLLPLNLEQIYAEQGAVLFGTLTSVNAVVVIVGTPLLTKWISGLQDVSRLLIGQLLVTHRLFLLCLGTKPAGLLLCGNGHLYPGRDCADHRSAALSHPQDSCFPSRQVLLLLHHLCRRFSAVGTAGGGTDGRLLSYEPRLVLYPVRRCGQSVCLCPAAQGG